MSDVGQTVQAPPASGGVPELPSRIAVSGLNACPDLRRRLEVALFLVIAAGRCAFSLPRSLFRLFPDEPGTFAMARWLSGTGDWDMGYSLTWKPGMATLIAPLFWVTDNQETIVRGALVIGALVGGLGGVLLSRLLTRLTSLSDQAAIVIAGLIALSPSSLSASAFVWAEPLVTLTFLGTVLTLLRFFDAPSARLAIVTILCSGAGYLSHSRMLPLVITIGFLTAGKFVWDRNRGKAMIAIGLTFTTIVAVDLYSSLFYSALWADPNDNNTVSEVAARLDQPVGIAFALSGQLWYLLVATGGLFGIGATLLTARSVRDADRRTVRDARLIMAAMLPLIGLSVLFMSDRERVDQQIYGRYNDAITWPIVGLGVAWLVGAAGRASWRTGRERLIIFVAIALAIVETTMATVLMLERSSVNAQLVAQMIPGVAGLLLDPHRINVILIGVTALAVLSAIALSMSLISQHRRAALAVVVVCLIALSVRTRDILEIQPDWAIESTSVQELVGTTLEEGDTVVYGFVPVELKPGADLYRQGYYSQLYQWYLPEIEFRVTERGDYPDTGYAFAPVFDRVLVERGACIVWRDPVVGIVLWDVRGARCEESAADAGDQQSPPD